MLMAQTPRAWTLAELDRLPDDGNRYEVIDGELFVTPAPSPAHEALASVLHAIIEPYARAQQIGRVYYRPRAVVRVLRSEVERDLMVRPITATPPLTWAEAPTPSLVVEILSATTRRRDHVQKREFYLRIGVAEYWIVDRWDRTIRVITPATDDVVLDSALVWRPTGTTDGLVIDVAEYFREALGVLA